MQTLINLTAFKVSWVATVFGAAAGWPLIGPLFVAGAALLHLRRSHQPYRELSLLALAGLLGLTFDSLLLATGWIAFPDHTSILAPLWMFAMWILFATTLNVGFHWLRPRLWLAAVLGAIFGPLSYWSGSRTGALIIVDTTSALVTLSAGWAVLMPLLIVLATRLDGISEATPAPVLKGGQVNV